MLAVSPQIYSAILYSGSLTLFSITRHCWPSLVMLSLIFFSPSVRLTMQPNKRFFNDIPVVLSYVIFVILSQIQSCSVNIHKCFDAYNNYFFHIQLFKVYLKPTFFSFRKSGEVQKLMGDTTFYSCHHDREGFPLTLEIFSLTFCYVSRAGIEEEKSPQQDTTRNNK